MQINSRCIIAIKHRGHVGPRGAPKIETFPCHNGTPPCVAEWVSAEHASRNDHGRVSLPSDKDGERVVALRAIFITSVALDYQWVSTI